MLRRTRVIESRQVWPGQVVVRPLAPKEEDVVASYALMQSVHSVESFNAVRYGSCQSNSSGQAGHWSTAVLDELQ